MQKESKSWKDKLRNMIREVISYSRSFEDFLKNCTDGDIKYVYKPSNKVKLKFRLSGEGKWKKFLAARRARWQAELDMLNRLSAKSVELKAHINTVETIVSKMNLCRHTGSIRSCQVGNRVVTRKSTPSRLMILNRSESTLRSIVGNISQTD